MCTTALVQIESIAASLGTRIMYPQHRIRVDRAGLKSRQGCLFRGVTVADRHTGIDDGAVPTRTHRGND